MEIIVQRADEKVKMPIKGHFDDSGFDLFAVEDISLAAGEVVTVKTNVKFKMSQPFLFKILNKIGFGIGVESQIRPKSGRSAAGIEVSLGTIDQGYRNFVGVTLNNRTKKKVTIKTGEKIAQIVFAPVFNRVRFIEGDVSAETSRGLGGFGSTGLS